MRLLAAAAAAAVLFAGVAQAADLLVSSPGITSNSGLREVAEAYTKATGIKVVIKSGVVEPVTANIRSGAVKPDVIILPMNVLSNLALEKRLVPSSFTAIGRVDLGLFAKPDGPRPQIDTVEQFAAALKAASVVMYTDPSAGSMQAAFSDRLLKRPEFSGVKGLPVKGDAEPALKRGEGDRLAMGLGLIHDPHPRGGRSPNPWLVGPLPLALEGYIDMAGAVAASSTDPAGAAAFLKFATQPQMREVWREKGLDLY